MEVPIFTLQGIPRSSSTKTQFQKGEKIMEEPIRSSAPPPSDAPTTAVDLLNNIISKLGGATVSAPAGETRLFFPDGIDLISLTVNIPPVDITVEIAGPKSTSATQKSTSLSSPPAIRQITICDENPSDVHAKVGDVIRWNNPYEKSCRVEFNIDGCPLSNCCFNVPAQGHFDTTVVGPGGGLTYDYSCPCCPTTTLKGSGGNGKVIID
jgi:plastocyanin